MELRRRFYIDPDVQFPVILALIFLVTVQGVFVGWALSKAIAAARHWQNPDQAAEFFKILLFTLLPLVALNFLIGTWLSHKIAGPLLRIRQAMDEVSRGNLEVEVVLRSSDFLRTQAQEMNRMVGTLRRLIYRDHAYATEIDALMSECRDWLAKRRDVPEAAREELGKLIDGAKSRLSIINAHFMKGRLEAAQREEP